LVSEVDIMDLAPPRAERGREAHRVARGYGDRPPLVLRYRNGVTTSGGVLRVGSPLISS
jgi:hypothetical protein